MTKQRMVAVVVGTALIGGSVLAAQEGPPAAGEGATAPASYQEQIDTFFDKLGRGEHTEAIDGLYAGSPIAAELGGQLEELKNQLGEIATVMGDYLGQERIAVQPLGERFVYAWYVAYFETRPLQVHFSFYKPRDRWLVYQLAYDQGLSAAAQELARRRLAESPPPERAPAVR